MLKNSAKPNEIETNLAALIDMIPNPVLLIDRSGRIFEANSCFGKFTGYTKEQLIGKSIADIDFISPKGKQFIASNLKANLEGTEARPYESKITTKSGDAKFLKVNAKQFNCHGEKSDLFVFYDVSEENKIQDFLRQDLLVCEEKFRNITNSIKEAIIVVDDQARVTYWNPSAEKSFGYTSQEAMGKKIHELVVPGSICPEAKQRIETSVKTFTQTGMGYYTVGNVEVVGRHKDGSEFPVELSLSPTKLNGKWSAVGVVNNITQRRLAEQKLRDAERRFHTLFNQAPLGVLIVDPSTGGFVEFNDLTPLQLGYSREEFEKLTVYDIEAEKSPERVKEYIKKMLAEGKNEFETKHRAKNGEIKNVWVITRTFPSGNKTFLHCVYRDITEIKKVQKALVKNEELSRAIVANAPIGIATSDTNYRFISANEAFCQILGYTEEELKKLTFRDVTYPGDLDQSFRKMEELQAGKVESFKIEKRYIKKDGTKIIGRVITNALRDQTGKAVLFIAELEDITKPKQLEDDLRSSEERFRAISTSAMDAIILSDQEDNVIYWNPAAEKIFGYEAKETKNKKLRDLVVPPHGYNNHLKLLAELKGQPLPKKHCDYLAKKKDGSLFPIDLAIVPVNLKEKVCLLSIVRDITEWKAMEETLRRERDMLESVASNIDAGLIIIDKDYHVMWANQRLKQVSGIENLENKFCYSFFDNQSKCICEDCGVKKIFEQGIPIDRHDHHLKRGKTDKWIELITTPVKDKDGKVVAALELAVDITERKRLQTKLADYSQRLEQMVQKKTEQLKQAQAELVKSERLAAIGELAGMVGHDLRNPLSGIKNSAYFMKKKGDAILPDQAREMLEIIDKCVDYSNKIVNDLLDYSRDVHLHLQEESPRKLLLESISIVDIPEAIELVSRLKDKPTLPMDREQIKRVFINLIKNAIDAITNCGKITIESRQVNRHLEITFTDTGKGISDEILPKLFSPLFTTKAQGMGFGLAICKRIIEAHGGNITVKTVKDQGTTFTVTLPIDKKNPNGGENIWINTQESSLLTMMKQSEQQ